VLNENRGWITCPLCRGWGYITEQEKQGIDHIFGAAKKFERRVEEMYGRYIKNWIL
jgi:hypothetical protein